MSDTVTHTIYGIGPDGGALLTVGPDGKWSSAYANFKEVAGILNAVTNERDAAKSDLQANAAMLARQCDMARQAENERDDSKVALGRLNLELDGKGNFLSEEERKNELLRAKNAQLKEALHLAWGVIQWMSGSDDFAPGGKSHEGWIKAQYDIGQIRSLIKDAG